VIPGRAALTRNDRD